MSFLIISASLNPDSRSRILANYARSVAQSRGMTVDFMDLEGLQLPLCDGHKAYEAEGVDALRARIESAQGILIASAIYHFSPNAAARNIIELTGSAWKQKVVGFLCAAGGKSSYMSVMSLANSLMLDFRCWIVPRFVYAIGSSFENDVLTDEGIKERVSLLIAEWERATRALNPEA
ncbi:MAG: NAD(P)H-dependent oxidoreductase [Candidatus Nitrohelix vancouverensis]|uniref:NAD(P)H-dependent oxidoreductase n=1 Tax=Candidatus Nitrohelix vancouverensis TaxID=2705534 RepID=A0A7T0C3A5_9BACT|nr:MAG: NAD(P)H-dependent oxidoreductase [Candidatus Nitrohelix vancouverensis]